MPNTNKHELSLEYAQAPRALRLALIDASRHGYGSTYDRFKAFYAPSYFNLPKQTIVRSHEGVGERRYTQQVIGSYAVNGLLVSLWSRSQIDPTQRERDFLVATANMEGGSIEEWGVREVDFSSDKYGALRQDLVLQPGSWRNSDVELMLTSQGCWLDDQPLAPLAELEGSLSDIHYRYGQHAVQAFVLSEEEQAAIVAA